MHSDVDGEDDEVFFYAQSDFLLLHLCIMLVCGTWLACKINIC